MIMYTLKINHLIFRRFTQWWKNIFSQVCDTRSWVSPKICSERAENKDCSQTKGALAPIGGYEIGVMTICFVQTMWPICCKFLKAQTAYAVLSTEVLWAVRPDIHMRSLVQRELKSYTQCALAPLVWWLSFWNAGRKVGCSNPMRVLWGLS